MKQRLDSDHESSTFTSNDPVTDPDVRDALAEAYPSGTYDIDDRFVLTGQADGGTSVSVLVGGTDGTPATIGSGGVTITVAEDILSSTVAVDGNRTEGSVTGNTADNRITVSATDLGEGGTLATAAIEPSTTDLTATADHAVSNVQRVGSVDLTTAVASEFGIITDGEGASDVASSSLSVSGNTQMATSIANTGTNGVSLSATNLESSAAVMSTQLSRADVVANSTMFATAPAAIDSSTLEMNDNRNQSVATINTATNTVSVDATNATSISGGEAALLDAPDALVLDLVAYADNALMNLQQTPDENEGSVSATATTFLQNGDMGERELMTGIGPVPVKVPRVREARAKAAPAGTSPASGNAGTLAKHDYLNAALERAMEERQSREQREDDDAEAQDIARPSQRDLARKAMALKAASDMEPNAMMEGDGPLHPSDPDASKGKGEMADKSRRSAPSGALDHAGELPSRERSRTRY